MNQPSDKEPDDGDLPPDAAGMTSLHVGRARGGDPASLEWIVRRLTPILLKSAEYRLGKRLRELYDPEDLVSDVWLATLPKLSQLSAKDGRYTPVLLRYMSQTLIYRLNNLIEKHIKGKPLRQRAAPSDDGPAGDPIGEVAADVTSDFTRLVRRERSDVVSRTLDELSERDRELIILRGVEQRPYKEIAPLLERDHKVLAVEYRRALEKLRRKLPGSVFDEFETD